MSFLEFNSASGRSLFKEKVSSALLEVRESSHYRWFHYGGNVVQSIMDIEQPHRVLLPVPLSMLMFLLWRTKPVSVLNLGMGSGGFERALSQYNDINVTSVESELKIIEMAQTYFSLPKESKVVHVSAECFLQENSYHYNVILCDLFFNEKSPLSLYQDEFYQRLHYSLSDNGIAFINLHPESAANLSHVLNLGRQYFDHVALVEFENYANIVIILSQQKLPNLNELNQANNNLAELPGDFTNILEKMHFLPPKES